MEPLAVEGVLEEDVEGHSVGVGLGVLGPLLPAGIILVVEGGKAGVIGQPGQVGLLLLLGGGELGVALKGLAQQGNAGGVEVFVVHPVRVFTSGRFQLLGGKQALGGQLVQVDEQGVARKGGGGHVGGISVAQGDQRQDLPIALARLGQKVHKAAGGRPQRADAVRARQGGDGQKNAAEARVVHGIRVSFQG